MDKSNEETKQLADEAKRAIKLIHDEFGDYANYDHDYDREKGFFARLKQFLGKENEKDYIWMWKKPNQPHTFVQFENLQNLPDLCRLTPNTQEPVWFVVGIWLLSGWPVYEGMLREIEKITKAAPIINYYVIAKDFSWLISKNHRNEFMAIGVDVEKNLKRFQI